jgi:uncharacterized membrane protein YjgN (DUF898 family)
MVDDETKREVKRIFSLSRQEIFFVIIIFMLGVNMAFTFSLVNPILEIIENQYRIAYVGVAQNERILDLLTNGTDNSTAEILEKVKNINITDQ